MTQFDDQEFDFPGDRLNKTLAELTQFVSKSAYISEDLKEEVLSSVEEFQEKRKKRVSEALEKFKNSPDW